MEPKRLVNVLPLNERVTSVTYQQQMRRCGKPACKKCPHGPYWFKIEGRRMTYIGKKLPAEAAKALQAKRFLQDHGADFAAASAVWQRKARCEAVALTSKLEAERQENKQLREMVSAVRSQIDHLKRKSDASSSGGGSGDAKGSTASWQRNITLIVTPYPPRSCGI